MSGMDSKAFNNFESGDDVGDAWGYGTSNDTKEVNVGILSTSVDSDSYNMNHKQRGRCLIFSNRVFHSYLKLKERRGTEVDALNLARCFRRLNFRPDIYRDKNKHEIEQILKKVGKEDHANNDCFVCCVLTHGKTGTLYAKDGKYATDSIFEPFYDDACVSLAGKPKLFFIQACQGDKLDAGVDLIAQDVHDNPAVYKIPTRADMLIAYSTIPGYYSWRNTEDGSWFIQSLCKALEECGSSTDLLSLMTMVSHKVAYHFQSCVPDKPFIHEKKQVPCITSTLTRKIYFPPKFQQGDNNIRMDDVTNNEDKNTTAE